jgi:hypothetical protein
MKTIEAKLMNDREVAEALGVSVATTRRWRLLGGGPRYCRVGEAAIRYRPEDVTAYVESRLNGGERGRRSH